MTDLLISVWRELALFAGVGFLLFGLDDVLLDLLWLGTRQKDGVLTQEDNAQVQSWRLAVFIAAWDESTVIAAMLKECLSRWEGQDFSIYVGTYRNDPATQRAVDSVKDAHIHLVRTHHDGPTTKADCLNAIWTEFRSGIGNNPGDSWAIILHDAEDLVHPDELRAYRQLLPHFDMVQLPVLPLPDARSPWVAGHYLDEFAESHGKDLIVRTAIGASLPSAGVGCAIRADALEAIARSQMDRPFDESCLTEDYELGLRLAAMGKRTCFGRLRTRDDGTLIAVRAYFPDTLVAAVRQKTRWITGIALAGWDRTGWTSHVPEIWMRWRDRRSILAALVMLSGYLSACLALLLISNRHFSMPAGSLGALLSINFVFLCWRLGVRAYLVRRDHGWSQAFMSVPRALVSSTIAIMASRRAFMQYLGILKTGTIIWDKTRHHFPDAQKE
jgi:adsorption protein B